MKAVSCRVLVFILVSLTVTGLALAKTNTTTALTSSANPSTYASSVTFTATVSPSAATGTVTFNVGYAFGLAAQQKANDLQAQGNKVIACRVSTIEDVNAALTLNGLVGGDVHYFGHSGLVGYTATTGGPITSYASMLFVGQGAGSDANIAAYNYTQLCSTNSGCNINTFLSSNTAIRINGCQAAETVWDVYAQTYTSIARLLSNQLNRGVYAYDVGMYFSSKTPASDPYFNGEGRLAPGDLPVYMVPAGAPGNKPGPKGCRPFAGCS